MKVTFEIDQSFLIELRKEIVTIVKEVLSDNLALIKSEQVNLKRKDAASRLKISLRSLDRYIADGSIRVSRLKRVVLIPESEIERFLKNQ